MARVCSPQLDLGIGQFNLDEPRVVGQFRSVDLH